MYLLEILKVYCVKYNNICFTSVVVLHDMLVVLWNELKRNGGVGLNSRVSLVFGLIPTRRGGENER